MPPGQPKFKRRKAERPDEIVGAAIEVFAERGFAAARLDDIAARAGVSKGAIYLYFSTKEDIFRAVIEQGVAPNLGLVQGVIAADGRPFADRLRAFAEVISTVAASSPVGGIIKMVIGESRNFPELARAWYEQLIEPALGALTAAIEAAQARGELKAGNARQYAVSLISPMLLAVIWRETFAPIGAAPLDIPTLARQHVELWLRGMETAA